MAQKDVNPNADNNAGKKPTGPVAVKPKLKPKTFTPEQEEELRKVERNQGLEGLFNELYDVRETIIKFDVTHYHVEGNDVYYKDQKLELIADTKKRPNRWLYASAEDDPMEGNNITPYQLLTHVKFVDVITGKDTKASRKKARNAALDDEYIKMFISEKSWNELLASTKDKDGNITGYQSNTYNVMIIFKHDPYFAELKYNAWTHQYMWKGNPLKDSDIADFVIYFGQNYSMYSLKPATVQDAVHCVENYASYDPLIDYLNECYRVYGSSGTYEMDHMFQEFLGCEDSPYTVEVARLMLCGAISRAFKPGCKFDTMFLIQGARQGQGKSTLIKKLGAGFGREDISIKDFETKAIAEKMRGGAWLCEIPEMDGLSGLNENTLKAMLSKSEDYFRPAYARNMVEIPRRTVFVGTVNDTDDLFTDVKNRRFVVLQCNEAEQTKFSFDDKQFNEESVRKIWGQAMRLYVDGTYEDKGLVLSEDSAEIASEICESLVKHDLALSQLVDFLKMPRGADWENKQPYEKAKAFRGYINNANAVPGDFVSEISLPEIIVEMLNKEISAGVGDDRMVTQIKKELTRLGYHKGGTKVITGYGKSVQIFKRIPEAEHKKPFLGA